MPERRIVVVCFLTLGSAKKDRLMTLATIISRLYTIAPTNNALKSQSHETRRLDRFF